MFRLLLLFMLAFPVQLNASNDRLDNITINLPEQIIVKELKNILPIDIVHGFSNLSGNLTITDIENLKFLNDHIYFDLTLFGQDLELITKIASRDVHLELGSISFNLNAKTVLRFDSKNQILFFRLFVNNIHSKDRGQIEVVKFLLPLINNKEFAIPMEKFQPIIIGIGYRQIYYNMDIINIRANHGVLEMHIIPKLSIAR